MVLYPCNPGTQVEAFAYLRSLRLAPQYSGEVLPGSKSCNLSPGEVGQVNSWGSITKQAHGELQVFLKDRLSINKV